MSKSTAINFTEEDFEKIKKLQKEIEKLNGIKLPATQAVMFCVHAKLEEIRQANTPRITVV